MNNQLASYETLTNYKHTFYKININNNTSCKHKLYNKNTFYKIILNNKNTFYKIILNNKNTF